MGNTETKDSKIIISQQDYITKLQYYESIEAKVKEQNLTIEYMTNEKEQLRNEIQNLQLKDETMKEKLKQYESLKILNDILDINAQIITLKEDIIKFLNSAVNNETHAEINKLKENVTELMFKLENNCVSNVPEMKMKELEKLELKVNDQVSNCKTVNNEKCKEMLEDLEKTQQNMSMVIAKHLSKIDKELMTKRSLLDDMEKDQMEDKYEEIKSLLIEQENIALKHMLNSTKDTNVAPTPVRIVKDDNASHSIIICDVPETSTDNIADDAKIKEILQLFPGLSEVEVQYTRLGRWVEERTRKIKVTFPQMDHVAVAVKNRFKLKNSSYSAARLYSAKSEYSTPIREQAHTSENPD